MADAVARISRAVAQRLAAELGMDLVVDVEAALHGRDSRGPEQYFDPITLGGLIVSVSTLAWNIHKDLRSKGAKPDTDVVAQTIRVELGTYHDVTAAQRDRIIDVVVTATLDTAESDATRDETTPSSAGPGDDGD